MITMAIRKISVVVMCIFLSPYFLSIFCVFIIVDLTKGASYSDFLRHSIQTL